MESEEKFRSLFNTIMDGIIGTCIKTKRIVLSNPRAQKMLGYSE
ncbi:MAG: PAS domain-containing protein [Candidatus Omnitrophica bacterium]|nr:PAS domain-containing protein [Candidatus Omnitrophota bacterium]